MEPRQATLGGIGAALAAAIVLAGTDSGGTAVALLFVLAVPGASGLLGVALWIAGGALVLGAIGWGVVTLFVSAFPPVVGLGLGVAIGGGLGAVVRLLVLEDTTDTTETVSVDTSPAETTTSPTPADLFDTHPDPLLYYDTSGDGPVVRAANDAFVDTFDVAETMVEGAPLRDALLFQDTDPLVDAVGTGEAYDAVHTCETTDGDQSFRVRLAATETSGYVLYTQK